MKTLINETFIRSCVAVRLVVLICLFSGAFLSVNCFAQAPAPDLQGEKAIEQLRQDGSYDSLMKAVKASHIKNGLRENPLSSDAVGQSAKVTASDGSSNDNFGYSVAISGNTAIIGAYRDDSQGSAYIFDRTFGAWAEQAKLVASDGATNDLFGISVSISGNTVIVGASFDDVSSNTNQGSAYIFVRSVTTWTEQQRLTAPDPSPDDNFGNSVAISGDTVIVGAYRDGDALSDQGSAYIFVRSGTSWAMEQKFLAADPGTSDFFGNSVAIDGNTAIVGAYFNNVGSNSDEGSAYIFVRSGTSWTYQQTLLASDGATGDHFGVGVSVAGDTALVGSFFDNIGSNTDQGSAYVFVRSGATWIEQQKLTASDGTANDNFGNSVAILGDTAIVGVPFDDFGAYPNQGSAYIFSRSGTSWTQQQKLNPSDGMADDLFGISVAISGETVIVGAYFNNVGSNVDQGSAYTFRRLSSGWGEQTRVTSATGNVDDQFGNSVAISGDRAIVGSYLHDVGSSPDRGAAYIFLRTGTTWTEQAQLTASDGETYDRFGNAVAIYGDTVVVGAYFDDDGANTDQGSAYIFVRIGSTWTEQQKLTASDGEMGDFFGKSVGISGDTVIVGASHDDIESVEDLGSVYFFTRTEGIWTQQGKFSPSLSVPFVDFGYSVAIEGNTAIVGAAFDSPNDDGAAFILIRQGTTWTQQQKLTASDSGFFHYFGTSVAISADTVIIGAIGANYPSPYGAAYIFVRTGTIWTEQQKLTASDGAESDRLGISVAISGDTAMIGADFADIGTNTNQGAAYMFSRNGTTWMQEQKLVATGGASGDQFGYSVAISGDKVIVGAFGVDVTSFAPSGKAAQVNHPLAGVDQGAAFFFTNLPAAPTAASVTIGGRVLTASGRGIYKARVTMTSANGARRTALTNPFGYYTFADVAVGESCVFEVSHKRYSFTPQFLFVSNAVDALNFTALE